MRLKGKRALITGGGSGIGLDAARAFAAEGAKVLITGRTESKLKKAAEGSGGRIVYHTADLSDMEQVKSLASAAEKELGAVDILYNNAGIYNQGTILDMEIGEWDRIFDNTVRQVFVVSKAIIPLIQKAGGGSIINNSSTLGLKAVQNCVAYCSAKAGLNMLTRTMALDLAKEKIRVNAISPGVIITPVHEGTMQAMGEKQWHEMMGPMHPLGHVGEVADTTYLALYLASDESKWVTGTIIPVDGGLSAL